MHGREPQLALRYSSQAGNGIAGVGWELEGFSEIKRSGLGRGVPVYDGSDVFLLDGQELVACETHIVSPSCATGGTHATKTESYRRIERDLPSDSWFVWDKDGTRNTYSPTHITSGGTFRWGITQTKDTSENAIYYTWWCHEGDCYPKMVFYDIGPDVQYGPRIDLYYQPRNDTITFPTGVEFGATTQRLMTIDVSVGTLRVRAYRLKYTMSATTNRSLLQSIQQFGTDAVLLEDHRVFDGTSLPPTTFEYHEPGDPWQLSDMAPIPVPIRDQTKPGWDAGARLIDLNGDGRADVLQSVAQSDGPTLTRAWINDGSNWVRDDSYADVATFAECSWCVAA